LIVPVARCGGRARCWTAYIFATVLAVSAFGYSTSNTWIGDTSRLWIAAVVLALIGLHKSYNRNRNGK
jgi:hypothetical protein